MKTNESDGELKSGVRLLWSFFFILYSETHPLVILSLGRSYLEVDNGEEDKNLPTSEESHSQFSFTSL